MSLTVAFSNFFYAITNALLIYRTRANFLVSLQTEELISHYYLLGQHSYTRGPLADTKALSLESPDFKYQAEVQSL
jgi:hypothetical protein